MQVSWAWAHEQNHPTRGLLHHDFNPINNWQEFVAEWASLLTERVDGKDKLIGLLYNWLRDPENTGLNTGVGVYSCSELLFLAGKPDFDSSSRLI